MNQTTDLLVCAATLMELRTFWPDAERFETVVERDGFVQDGQTAYLLTGVGIPCALGRTLAAAGRARPARILNIGIAGAYPSSGLTIGQIILGGSEVYGDVGFELPASPGFRPIRESPFGGEFYAQTLPLVSDSEFVGLENLSVVPGCTVNACTGTDAVGRRREQLFGVGFETMEGAAVAQAGWQHGVPVCEVRAISNIAAHRDMRPENIRFALARLRDYFQLCRDAKNA